jgi:cobalt/nickel transport system permease protein
MQKAIGAVNGMLSLEELASGGTAVHRLHPAAKLIATLVYLVCVISVGRLDFPALSLFFFYPALLIPLAGIPVRAIVRRLQPALPLVLLAGLSNVLFEPAAALTLGGIAVSRGVVSLIVLLEKAALSVGAVLLLMATTPAAQLLACLRRAGVPRVLVTVTMLGIRYLTLLVDEASRMARAYALRAARPGGIQMRDMGSFVGQLLLRSFDRAERVYQAMKLRGYDGDYPTAAPRRMDPASAAFALGVSAAAIFCRFFTVTDILNRWF